VGFWASIPLWLVTLLGSLFITVLAFIMILTVYGRFFKIYMYAALSPVALASFAGEAIILWQGVSQSYIAVCMEARLLCWPASSFCLRVQRDAGVDPDASV
jgi:hypothetical protein